VSKLRKMIRGRGESGAGQINSKLKSILVSWLSMSSDSKETRIKVKNNIHHNIKSRKKRQLEIPNSVQ